MSNGAQMSVTMRSMRRLTTSTVLVSLLVLSGCEHFYPEELHWRRDAEFSAKRTTTDYIYGRFVRVEPDGTVVMEFPDGRVLSAPPGKQYFPGGPMAVSSDYSKQRAVVGQMWIGPT
jgi:hypothetical protein